MEPISQVRADLPCEVAHAKPHLSSPVLRQGGNLVVEERPASEGEQGLGQPVRERFHAARKASGEHYDLDATYLVLCSRTRSWTARRTASSEE